MLGKKDKTPVEVPSENDAEAASLITALKSQPQGTLVDRDAGIRAVQERLKRLTPAATDNGIPINQLSSYCARTLEMALNLEWFGKLNRTDSEKPLNKNVIVVRISYMDISLAEFFTRIRGILTRISGH